MSKNFRKIVGTVLLSAAVVSMTVGAVISYAEPAARYTVVDAGKRYQTWQGWGTSLCWWANAVGGWTMEGVSGKEKREELMDLTFSENGLNLNIVRYNAGGGDDPEHTHMNDYRDMPGIFSSAYSTANLSADANQLYVLDAAMRIRAETAEENGTQNDFVSEIFNNSPPYWLTESGCSSGNLNAADENLSSLHYDEFITWFVDVIEALEKAGYRFDYVEPMNEPGSDYWAAYGSQEGNRVYAGDNQSEIIVRLAQELESRGLQSGKVTCGDETSSIIAYENYQMLTDEAIAAADKLNYHIYSKSDSTRTGLGDLIYGEDRDYANADKELWMSEICYGSGIPDSHDDMTFALEMASDIQKDAYLSGVTAWIIWQVVESELSNLSYGNSYGLIHGVYQDEEDNNYGIDMSATGLNRGDYFLTKQYYALGQYSRYIGSGYQILAVDDDDTVAALSPDGKELVLVVSNAETAPRQVNYYLKQFEAEQVTRVETSADKNWYESSVAVSNDILKDTVAGESIVTYVIKGDFSNNASVAPDADILSATQSNGTIAIAYLATDANADYTLYCSDDREQLTSLNGVSGLDGIALDCSEDGSVLYGSVSVDDDSAEHYVVIEQNLDGVKRYTAVVRAQIAQTDNTYTYFTDCGSDTFGTWIDGMGEFGLNYRYTDKVFSLDPASGKEWGNASGTEGVDYERNKSQGLWNSCVYGVNGKPIIYRYEVEAGKTYNVTAGFRDVWGNYNRTIDFSVNGTKYGTVKCYNDYGSTLQATGVQGVEENGKFYITVTAAAAAGTTQDALINFIVIQDESADEADIVFEGLPAISIPYGQNMQSVFPETLHIVTTHGTREVRKEALQIDPFLYDQVYTAGGYTTVTGSLKGTTLTFKLNFTTENPFEHVYYWYNLGVADGLGNGQPDSPTDMTAEHLSEFNAVYMANQETLINTDAKKMNDKVDLTKNPDGYGLVSKDEEGNTYTYPSYWSNNEFMSWSMIEGATNATICMNFPNLPANHYVIEVGSVNPQSWGDRSMQLYVNDQQPVVFESSMKDFPFSTQVECVLEEAGTIRFKAVGTLQNPILTYVIVKTVAETPTEQRPSAPAINSVLDRNVSSFTVGNLTAGATLVLTDQDGMCLAERVVGENETSIEFTDFDFTGIASVTAQQFSATGSRSQAVTADVPLIQLSAPRTEWSVEADTIVVTPVTSVGMAGLYLQRPGQSIWTDIRENKFFRAEENGVYTVKLVTKTGAEIFETVTVEKVDKVQLNVLSDLKTWVDTDLEISAELSLQNGLSEILLTSPDGGQADISDKYSNGMLRFTVGENGNYVVKVTTTEGGVKEFDIIVSNIDKTSPTINLNADDENGSMVVRIDAVSGSEKHLFVSYDGETTEITSDVFKFIGEGEYVFTVKNSFGVSASASIAYYNGREQMEKDGILLSEDENRVTLLLPQTAGEALLQQFGSEEARTVNSSEELTQNGVYRLTLTEGDKITVYEFAVSSFETPSDAPVSQIALPVSLAIAGVTFAIVVALGVVCLIRLKGARK